MSSVHRFFAATCLLVLAGCATGSNLYDDACGLGACADAGEAAVDAPHPRDAAMAADARSRAEDATAPPVDATVWIDAPPPPDAPLDAGVDAAPLDASVDAAPLCKAYFTEHFDDNAQGWTLDPSWSIAAPCTSPPSPQKGNPDPAADHTGGASGVAAAYACGNNPGGAAAPMRYATSPEIDLSAAPGAKLTFYRWLNSDQPTWMTSTVDVYDGSAWQNVYKNPGSLVTDSAWTKVAYDVTAYENAHFKVRFGYALLSSSVYAMSDWNVDDLVVEASSCP